MSAPVQMPIGERMIAPVTNISDFIWGGTWNGEAVIPFPPLAIILLGIGAWVMIGLRFYPIVKLGSAFAGLFRGAQGRRGGRDQPVRARCPPRCPARSAPATSRASPRPSRWAGRARCSGCG